jgi:gluconolactonase
MSAPDSATASRSSPRSAAHRRRFLIDMAAACAPFMLRGSHALAAGPARPPLPEGVRVLASGLRFPEHPVALADGSVLVCEVAGGRLTRVYPEGRTATVAVVGGSPSGAAIGPDGAVYVCAAGPRAWREVDGLLFPGAPESEAADGTIHRIDLERGTTEALYRDVGGHRLSAPNDLVFDADGGFWFTDIGKSRARSRDHGGIYYALADGSSVREARYPLLSPNGIALSPDGKRLYVSDLYVGALLAFEITGPGELAPTPGPLAGRLVARLPGREFVDGMAVEDGGAVCIATPLSGGVTCIAPDGATVQRLELPDTLTTNLCFGGADRRTAFITLGGTGQLVAMDWPRPGLKLHFNA